MPGPEHQDRLGEPGDLDETLEELMEELRELAGDGRSFAAQNRATAEDIGRDVDALGLDTYHDEGLERAQRGVVENPREAVADPDSAEVIAALRKKLNKLSMELAKSPTNAQTFNLQRFLAIFAVLSSTAATASLIYNAIHAAQHDDPAPPQLPPDTAAKVRELVRQWNTQPDAAYWNDLARYVSLPDAKVPLTLADQVLFMNYTIDLSPAGEAWLWDTGQDVVGLVDGLVGEYNSTQTTAAMYRRAATLKYKDTPIPRPVTAGLLRLALGQVIVFTADQPRFPRFPVLGGEPGEDKLSEPPDDERGAVEEEAERARREDESFTARIREAAVQISQTVDRLDASTLNCDAVEAAWTEPVAVPNSAIADPEPDARLTELLTRLDSLTAASAKSRDASKKYSCSRYLAAFFGLSAIGAAAVLLVEYLSRSSHDQPTDDITSIPADVLDQIRELVRTWKDQDEKAYWESLASYLEKNPAALTRLDQIVFMNYTIQLCPPARPFLWDSAKDKAATADKLVETSKGGADLPGMYRSVSALRYNDAPLPRAVAADVLRLALGWLKPVQQQRPPAVPGEVPAAAGVPGRIPERLRPAVYVADVAPGGHPVAYARTLHALLRPAGVTDHAELAAAGAYVQPDTSPFVLADAAAVLDRLPAPVRTTLQAQAAQLTGILDGLYPVPAGETLLGSQLTCLAEPGGGLAAGTVVYVRRTGEATVYFALPHIAVDPAAGTPNVVGLDVEPPAEDRPMWTPTRFDSGATSIALSVAGNLVWALPPPWGPLSAGALTLIQLLLASDSKPDQLGLVVQELEQFIKHRDINSDATHIKAFADWLNTQTETLRATQADNSTYITSTLLPELRKMVAPGDESVYDAVYDLEQYLDVPGTLDVLVLGVSIYLLALKMTVQLDATLASTARNDGNDAEFASYTSLWLADYANFVFAVDGYTRDGTTVAGWAARIAAHVDTLVNQRLAKITAPYRYDAGRWTVVTGGGATGTSRYWTQYLGWTYRDDGAGDTDTTNFVGDVLSGGDCCHDQNRLEYEQLVHQRRDAHVADVAGQLDTLYSDVRQTIRKWQSSILQWNQHVPPRVPTTAPTTAWTNTAAPSEPTDGAAVSYAVAFANAAGPSQPGPWSKAVPTSRHGYATLTDLPVDPLHMATNLWIFRRFDASDGTAARRVKVVGIVDTKTTTYTDKSP
ncbi:MAG: hypothetical protein ACJ73E_01255 [Mycobacteriales bacterium]